MGARSSAVGGKQAASAWCQRVSRSSSSATPGSTRRRAPGQSAITRRIDRRPVAMRQSAAHRLRAASEFSRVREQGVTRAGKYVIVNVLQLPEGGLWRSGIITSRKVGNAVHRNLVRRRLREIIRAATLQSGLWVVTVARPSAVRASFEDLRQDWLRTVRRAGALQDENVEAAS